MRTIMNKTIRVFYTVPVSKPKRKSDPGDILLEKISYKHDYDCRSYPSEPIRGKVSC